MGLCCASRSSTSCGSARKSVGRFGTEIQPKQSVAPGSDHLPCVSFSAFTPCYRASEHGPAMNWALTAASFGIGIVVGLTGMGGGALMTPMLVLFFNVPPLAAVSSDLVSSAVMKPVGSWVHLRRGTVNLKLVGWLCVGSVPAGFAGVLLARALGQGSRVEHVVQVALACALLVAALGLIIRAFMRLLERARTRNGTAKPLPVGQPRIPIRPRETVLVGALGGVVVGMTSVGSGSLMIIALMLLYPGLRANELVGTDLVQSVPLVASAAFGHILFGNFAMAVTLPLILGGLPGTYVGAHLSSRLPSGLVRRALAFVLLASALKTFEIDNRVTIMILAAALLIAPALWMGMRRHYGFPALVPRLRKVDPVRTRTHVTQ